MTETEATLARARAGDERRFRELTEPHRRELQLHCYRILGSVHDAEDMVQETLLAAWRSLEAFEGRTGRARWDRPPLRADRADARGRRDRGDHLVRRHRRLPPLRASTNTAGPLRACRRRRPGRDHGAVPITFRRG